MAHFGQVDPDGLKEAEFYLSAGYPDQAIPLLVGLLRRDGESPALLDCFASAQQANGELVNALKTIVKAEALAPDDARIAYNLGNIACKLGKIALGELAYRRSICLAPEFPNATNNYGSLLAGKGNYKLAGSLFMRALLIDQGYGAAWGNLGAALKYQGNNNHARFCYDKAISHEPDNVDAHYKKASLLLDCNEYEGAVASSCHVIILRPDWIDAYNNLAICLNEIFPYKHEQQIKFPSPAKIFRRILLANPRMVEAHTNIGNLCRETGDLDAAILNHQMALIIRPDYGCGWSNLASIWYQLGDFFQAIICYRRALQIQETLPSIRFNLSLSLLADGNWRDGWEYYEYRVEKKKRIFNKERWHGESLVGKTILIHGEQGFGDTIQFSRFIKEIITTGTKILFSVPRDLVRFLGTLGMVGTSLEYGKNFFILEEGKPVPEYDFYLPVMSLAYHLSVVPERLDIGKPYLGIDKGLAEKWRQRLSHLSGLKIGLVWAGDSRPFDRFANGVDQRRSVALLRLLPLLRMEAITFISLQKGDASKQINDIAPEFRPIDLGAELEDFADSAALASALDLVITVDTSTVHLAGAAGIPVWVLSRFDGCWRWQRGRSDTVWYETARLFWQSKPENWDGVVSAVSKELDKLRVRQ